MNTLFKTSLVSTAAVFAFAAGLAANVIGSGKVTSETRNVSDFHSIELRAPGNVIITQGETEGLVVEGEDNIVPLIESKVSDSGALQIEFKQREEIHLSKPLTFKVAAKTLTAIMVAGSGNINAESFKADRFAVRVLGSGDVRVTHLETDALTVAIDGSGNVNLAGKAAKQTVNVNGSGDYDAGELKTGVAAINVAGSGDCEIAASETLAATVSGSGDISYRGKPTVTKQVSGSGTVEALGGGK